MSDEQSSDALPTLLSLTDVCRLFGRSRRTIRRWVAEGYLGKPMRIRRAAFFKTADVLAAAPGLVAAGETLPVLISTRELCRLLGCSDRTIRNWVRAGRLRPVRRGRSVYYDLNEVDALLGSPLKAEPKSDQANS